MKETNHIISCRLGPGNFRLYSSSRDDSWYLKHVNDPQDSNVAREEKRRERKKKAQRIGNLFLRHSFFFFFSFPFQGQAMNMWERTLSSPPYPSSQQDPKSSDLTMPFPDYWFPLWDRLFMAEERQGCSRQGRNPKTYQEKYHDIPEGQSTLILNSLLIYPPSI